MAGTSLLSIFVNLVEFGEVLILLIQMNALAAIFMKKFLIATFLIPTHQLFAQIESSSSLQDSSLFRLKVKGHIKQVVKWADKLGVNYLVLSETDEYISFADTSTWGQDCKEERCLDKELYAYHFLNGDSLLWKVFDFQRACSADNIVEFRKNGTRVTDLDNNGIGETWIMYSITCTSDVSPRTLKLIMHQAQKKYVIRGTSQPKKEFLDEEFGGKYNPDANFSTLSTSFKSFAKKLWDANLYDIL
jgi:hypothetical protein